MAQQQQPKDPYASVRSKPVKLRSLGESWVALPPKTRLRISLVVTGIALAGVYLSDQLERVLPPTADKEFQKHMREGVTKEPPP